MGTKADARQSRLDSIKPVRSLLPLALFHSVLCLQVGCCVILWSSLIKLTFGSLSTLCGNIPHYYYGKKTVQLVA